MTLIARLVGGALGYTLGALGAFGIALVIVLAIGFGSHDWVPGYILGLLVLMRSWPRGARQAPRQSAGRTLAALVAAVVVGVALTVAVGGHLPIVGVIVFLILWYVGRALWAGHELRGLGLTDLRSRSTRRQSTLRRVARGESPAVAVREALRAQDGGHFTGVWTTAGYPLATSSRGAFAVLGAPSSGKSRGIIIPGALGHPGPLVSASTKPEVMIATLEARQTIGRALVYDPSGESELPAGAIELRWSPVLGAEDYDAAQRRAKAMVRATGAKPDGNGQFWLDEAASLVGVLLHAAALADLSIAEVLTWILERDVDTPKECLTEGSIPRSLLKGIDDSPPNVSGSIWSTARNVVTAYTGAAAARSASAPDQGSPDAEWLDADAFVRSDADTIYILGGSSGQDLVAPLIAGMLQDVKAATFALSAELRRAGIAERRIPPVLWSLDECANIAPLHDLASTLSEGGGQGLQLTVVFQDLSQVKTRWPGSGDGILSLATTFAVLPGIRDGATLDLLEKLAGDHDVEVETTQEQTGHTRQYSGFGGLLTGDRTGTQRSTGSSRSVTTRREPRLPASRIAGLKAGEALIFTTGGAWEIVDLEWWDQHPVWSRLVQHARWVLADPARSVTDAESPTPRRGLSGLLAR